MENRLNQIFSNVNRWLAFAEAKNGILLSLNGATIFGIVSNLKDASRPAYLSLTWVMIPFLIVTTMLLLISFLPITDLRFRKASRPTDHKTSTLNLTFYGDIRRLDPRTYLTSLYQSVTGEAKQDLPDFELQMSHQITNNAQICYVKFQWFKISCFLDMIGMLAWIVAFLVAHAV